MSSSTDDGADPTPEERLKEIFKSPYPEDADGWNALLSAIGNQIEEYEGDLSDVDDAKFIQTATNENLNKLAEKFDFKRKTGESASDFRTRLKTALRRRLTDATLEEIQEMSAVLLETNIEAIEMREVQTATLEVLTSAEDLSDAGVTGDVFLGLLDDITAAGVNGASILFLDTAIVRIIPAPVSHQNVNVNDYDFWGSDAFDGGGAFGAGNSDNPETTTDLSPGLVVQVVGTSVSSTGQDNFGSSAFGANTFDGADRDETVVGTNETASAILQIVASAVSHGTVLEGFGSGVFDGSGQFS